MSLKMHASHLKKKQKLPQQHQTLGDLGLVLRRENLGKGRRSALGTFVP